MKNDISIENFMPCIPLEQIEITLRKKEYKRFLKWMFGQTVPMGGVYTWDLERYLSTAKSKDKKSKL